MRKSVNVDLGNGEIATVSEMTVRGQYQVIDDMEAGRGSMRYFHELVCNNTILPNGRVWNDLSVSEASAIWEAFESLHFFVKGVGGPLFGIKSE
jgi:hypothetical protein